MMNDELPEGWVEVPLNDLLQPGGMFDGPFGSHLKTSDYTERGIRVLRLENLANLRFVEEKRTFISQPKYETLRKHTVVAGDILFGSFVDSDVRVCLVPPLQTPAVAKADCFCIRPMQEGVDRRFLVYQLGARATRDALLEEIHGVTRPRITTKQLRAFGVALAPLGEQRRIVEAVDALLAEVNVARERLARVPLILKRFRQSVLAAACGGRLTEEWRQRSMAGVSDDLPEPSLDDVPALPEIPADWKLVPLRAVVEKFQYGTSDKANGDERTGIPVLRMGNVQDGRIDLSDLKYISPSKLRREFLVQAGDVLFNRTNSPELVGKTAVVQDTRPMAFASYLIRMSTNPRLVAPEFLGHWLNSWWGRQWARQVRTDGVGQSNINATKLASMPIPLPTIVEQREIAARIDQLLHLANTIEQRVMATSAIADALAQGILAKAFRGELVPTEAELARADRRDYESGEALLARIRGERAPIVPPSKGHRGGALRAGARS